MAIYSTHPGVTTDQYRSAAGVPERGDPKGGLKAHALGLADDAPAYAAVLEKRYKDGGQTNWETVSAPPPSGA